MATVAAIVSLIFMADKQTNKQTKTGSRRPFFD
jgi:hypothetical protein